MAKVLEELREQMEQAADALDFETARRLRDRINLMRGGATAAEAAQADDANLARSRPGAMGLGTGQPGVVRPNGWKPPTKPDPMTKGSGRKRGKKPM